jgi:hypothetical protein
MTINNRERKERDTIEIGMAEKKSEKHELSQREKALFFVKA